MRPIPFVTNRPATTGGFGPPPPCGVPEVLSFGALTVLASGVPGRAGLVAGPVGVQGAVDCSGAGVDAALASHLAPVLAAAERAGRIPLVVVHDRGQGFAESIVGTGDLCAWLEAGGAGLALAPIAFSWPSVSGVTAESPFGERARAGASGRAFARFALAFAAARAAVGSPRCAFLAEGMGVRVSQDGGRVLAGMGAGLPADLFDQAIVMGGEADVDALQAGRGLDQLARMSGWLTVGLCEGAVAVGRPGAAAVPGNVRVVDYSRHGPLRSDPVVRDDVRAILSGTPPDEIDGRLHAGKGKRAGPLRLGPAGRRGVGLSRAATRAISSS